MGLDLVELVMEVEDRFGVKLPDAECQRVRTVADLAGLVITKLPRTEEACPTAAIFYELRRSMVKHVGAEPRRVRPGTHLIELFQSGLKRAWRPLRSHDRRIPALRTTPRVDAFLLWSTVTLFFAWLVGTGFLVAAHGSFVGLTASFGILILGIMLLVALGSALSTQLPLGMETVGDLVHAIAPISVGVGSPGARLIAQQRVLEEVRRITSEQLGIPLDRVKPESDFVKDLGAV